VTDRCPFNGLFSGTTWVSRHHNSSTNLDFDEAKDDGVAVASAGPHEIIYTSLQTDNHASTSSLNICQRLFLTPNKQHQSTEAIKVFTKESHYYYYYYYYCCYCTTLKLMNYNMGTTTVLLHYI